MEKRFFITVMMTISLLMIGLPQTFGIDPDQDQLVISGKVIGNETGAPLPFAGVVAMGTNISTVTNIDGEFTIKLYLGEAEEIEISSLGYKNKVLAVKDLKTDGKRNMITMDLSLINIQEITIKPLLPEFILQEALLGIRKNFENIPNDMTGFYRETVKKNRSYLSIGEAIVEIYKASYTNSFQNDGIRIYKGRRNDSRENADTILFKFQGGTTAALDLDFVKNTWTLFSPDEIKNFEYSLKTVSMIDDKSNYVIGFVQRPDISEPLLTGNIYVDVETYAISQIEFGINMVDEESVTSMLIRKKPAGMKITPEGTSYIVKYRNDGGKWYFAYSRAEVEFKVKWDKKLFNSTYTIMSELAITDRTDDDVLKFSSKERMKPTDIFTEEVQAFTDPDFWGDYNVIEPDQSIESAIRRLNRRVRFSDRETE